MGIATVNQAGAIGAVGAAVMEVTDYMIKNLINLLLQ